MSPRRLTHYLKTHRKRSGLSQKELAYLLGFRDGAKVSRLERMKRPPTVEDLLAYEVIFRIPVRELVAGLFDDIERKTIERIGVLARQLHIAKSDRHTERKLDALAIAVRAFREGRDSNGE